MPLPTGKMMLVLVGTFRGGIGSMCSLRLGCLILLHAPISISHCQDATRYMDRRKDEHNMMREFRRWRELAFPL